MIRLAADEDFNGDIVRGVLRRNAAIDIVRIQDAGLSGAHDAAVLAWAAAEGRVQLTHDVATMTRHAYARVEAGLPMPGVFEVSQRVPIGAAMEDVLLVAECSRDRKWEEPGSCHCTRRTSAAPPMCPRLSRSTAPSTAHGPTLNGQDETSWLWRREVVLSQPAGGSRSALCRRGTEGGCPPPRRTTESRQAASDDKRSG